MPDVYENPFTASLLDFFEEQQNARKKAPWASETPATWADGSPIGDVPDWISEDPYYGSEISDYFRNKNFGYDNPLDVPPRQRSDFYPWAIKYDDPYMWFDDIVSDDLHDNSRRLPMRGATPRQRFRQTYNVAPYPYRMRELSPESITGYSLEPSIPWLVTDDDYLFSESKGATTPVGFYDDMLSDARRGHELWSEGYDVSVKTPFYDAMLEDERIARLLDDYGIGPEEFVPELPVSKFTTDFRTDPSFLKLDSVDDALLMGSPYGADDYLAGLSSFTPGKIPVNAVDDVFDLAKNSAKAGKRAGSGLAASFRKLKNII